jgi:hypothetical protein|tara:strand:+ start:6719 stop:7798 length:1080 start_codon:yes stop_codon:yes gene_type:complete
MRKILLCLALSLLSAGAAAAEELLRETHPDRYVVKAGDTLWDVSSMFLNDAWRWPDIWQVNPDIENPHMIFPGDVITLTYVAGKPVLTIDRDNEGEIATITRPQIRTSDRRGIETVVLRQKVRATPITSAIPAIPLDAVASLLTTGRIVEQFTLDGAPHIIAGKADRLIFGPGDEFYARGNWTSNNSVYGIFRKGNVYLDPQTKEVLGFEAREVGLAKVAQRDGDLLTLEMTSVTEDVRIGDRLLPTEERRVESTFYPNAPADRVVGVIMNVMGGVTQVGRNNVVAINRGASHGLEVGNVLAIYKSGTVVRDRVARDQIELPVERAGLMMLFRIFDKMSYGLVLRTEEPLRVGDEVTNP